LFSNEKRWGTIALVSGSRPNDMNDSSEKVAQTVQFALFLERGELRKRRKLDSLRYSFSSFQGVAHDMNDSSENRCWMPDARREHLPSIRHPASFSDFFDDDPTDFSNPNNPKA
jgi:hypothetical protein